MKSPKFFFNLESRANKDGTRLVFFNLSYGYKEYNSAKDRDKYMPMRISTKVRIQPKHWSTELGYLDTKYSLNAGKTKDGFLKKVKRVSEDTLETYWRKNDYQDPKPSELKELVEIALQRKKRSVSSLTVPEYIDLLATDNAKLKQAQKGKLSDGTIDKYNGVKRQLESYESSRGGGVSLEEFSNKEFVEFLDYVNDQRKLDPKHPYGYLVNGISRISKTLLAVLRKAREAGYTLGVDLSDPNLRIEEIRSVDAEVYLDEDDIQRIIGTDPAKSKEFINARNYLIICSLTSLRYEDMNALHQLKVEHIKGKRHQFDGFLTKLRKNSKQKKRDVSTFIPVFKPVRDILDANGGKFPKFPTNQIMNIQLKKFAEYVGLDREYRLERQYYGIDNPVVSFEPLYQRVKCHMGRSTFITNLSKLGVDDTAIEHITHPTTPKGIISTVYNKSSLVDRAELFLDSLQSANTSDLYST